MSNDNGIMRHCGKFHPKSQRKISNLIGIWEIDKQAIEHMKTNNQLEQTGICNSHFSFDHQTLHDIGLKQTKEYIKGKIAGHRCIFCKKNYCIYLRGNECTAHCWSVLDKKTLIPCNSQYKCLAIESFSPLVQKIMKPNSQRPQYICNTCYEHQGGHLHQQLGRGHAVKDNTCVAKGEHFNDKTESLEILGKWLCNVVARTDNDTFKDKVLTEAASLLRVFQKSEPNTATEPATETTTEPATKTTTEPTTLCPLVIRTILKTNNMLPETWNSEASQKRWEEAQTIRASSTVQIPIESFMDMDIEMRSRIRTPLPLSLPDPSTPRSDADQSPPYFQRNDTASAAPIPKPAFPPSLSAKAFFEETFKTARGYCW
ncbi:6389_t:CDS:2 [Paraglomus brasilianum]|uniref:6389_t:CDS:1 n=1 Tax=Paraglomus brasilianum TaxID=144538 RepID=A0A9N9GEJ4_9GLOM|nr:6389_t:CDS:2 [Paraglomus brasilianum]